jgi:aminoglycoside phosphotransferase (APT) family kinase protein
VLHQLPDEAVVGCEILGWRWRQEGGRLLGSSGVGDPACDVTIAWTLFSGTSREAFRAALQVDGATWVRGRGWALWKALITFAGDLKINTNEAAAAKHVINEVLAEHEQSS